MSDKLQFVGISASRSFEKTATNFSLSDLA